MAHIEGSQNAITMSIAGVRPAGWTDEMITEEYTGVHAALVKALSEQVSGLRRYTQLLAVPKRKIVSFPQNNNYEMASSLVWSSASVLKGALKHPAYLQAGQHKFADLNQIDVCASSVFADVVFDDKAYQQLGQAALVSVFLGKSEKSQGSSEGDGEPLTRHINNRVGQVQHAATGTRLLRYVFNRAIPINGLFEGTLYEHGDWSKFAGLEHYWFPSLDAVVDFFDGPKGKELLSKLPNSFDWANSVCVTGMEHIVFK